MNSNRRDFLKSAALGGVAGVGTLLPLSGESASRSVSSASSPLVGENGRYESVELTKQAVTLACVQSRVRGVRVSNYKQDIRANLDHMLDLIDNTFHFGAGRRHFVFPRVSSHRMEHLDP